MKSLCIIAVSSVFMFGSVNQLNAQGWKESLGIKKTKTVTAEELTEEEIENLLGGRLQDDGITNDFHQQNLRKIVFHNTELDSKDVNASAIKKKFSINEPIYFTFYLPYSVRNHLLYEIDESGNKKMDYSYDYKWEKWKGTTETPTYNAYASTDLRVFIDGKEVEVGTTIPDVGFRSTKTVVSHYITADPSKKDVSTEWIDLVQGLSAGEHELEVKVYGYKQPNGTTTMSTLEPIATGSFTLVKNSGEEYAPKYGVSWDSYTAGMKDADLEAKMLQAVQKFAKAGGYKEEFTDLKIKSDSWIITRHEISGAVTGRNLVGYCKTKWPNGTCKVQSFIFRQEHNGTDFQDHIYCVAPLAGSYPKAIDCD